MDKFSSHKRFFKNRKIISDKLITLLYSRDLINEFVEVAQRPKFRKYFSNLDLQTLLLMMKENGEFVGVISKIEVCKDPKDNFLLALAMDANATHLITGDKLLLEIKTFSDTKIITISEYLSMK